MAAPDTYAIRLENSRKSIDKARTERITAEANKANLEKQQEGIIQEIKALGVEPEQLDQTITNLETEIGLALENLDALIPGEYKAG